MLKERPYLNDAGYTERIRPVSGVISGLMGGVQTPTTPTRFAENRLMVDVSLKQTIENRILGISSTIDAMTTQFGMLHLEQDNDQKMLKTREYIDTIFIEGERILDEGPEAKVHRVRMSSFTTKITRFMNLVDRNYHLALINATPPDLFVAQEVTLRAKLGTPEQLENTTPVEEFLAVESTKALQTIEHSIVAALTSKEPFVEKQLSDAMYIQEYLVIALGRAVFESGSLRSVKARMALLYRLNPRLTMEFAAKDEFKTIEDEIMSTLTMPLADADLKTGLGKQLRTGATSFENAAYRLKHVRDRDTKNISHENTVLSEIVESALTVSHLHILIANQGGSDKLMAGINKNITTALKVLRQLGVKPEDLRLSGFPDDQQKRVLEIFDQQ